MKIWVVAFFLCVAVVTHRTSATEKIRYDNYKVYSIVAHADDQVQALRYLETDSEYQFWTTSGLKEPIDIVVPPHKVEELSELISKLSLDWKVKVENLQELIEAESPQRIGRADATFGWENYYDLAEIYAFLDDLLARYPNVLTEERVGFSYHGTEIRAVKLSHKAGNPGLLIESNIHAREWITSATSTYVLNELLTSTDPAVIDIATNIDWYFIPVLNPDGFTYTKTTNRMWRKTRFPHSHLCYGVDLNRNFDFQWMHVGASQNPCDETYAGPAAFSDPESRALADYFTARKESIKVFFAFHSYGQYILTPFGYTKDPANNAAQLMQVGNAGAAAIRIPFGTEYSVGSTADILYMNSGSSRDWLKGVHNLDISYTIEFRDKGAYGFILPPDQILPNAIEIFDGIKAMVAECRTLSIL